MATSDTPSGDWERLHPLRNARELLRYRKADRTRTYQLRMLDDGSAELWVSTAGGRRESKSRKLMSVPNADDVGPLVETVAQELRAGGWVEV